MEFHLVHWNTRYGSLTDALMKRDGLGVLGFLFDVSDEANDFKDLDHDDKHLVRVLTSTFRFNLSCYTFNVHQWILGQIFTVSLGLRVSVEY